MSDLDTAAMREKYHSQAMHAVAGNFIPDITVLCDEIDRLRAGADPTPSEPCEEWTPGQWIHAFLERDEAGRLRMAGLALENQQAVSHAFQCDITLERINELQTLSDHRWNLYEALMRSWRTQNAARVAATEAIERVEAVLSDGSPTCACTMAREGEACPICRIRQALRG